MNAYKFKKAGEVQEGIKLCLSYFLYRAKDASKDAREYHATYKANGAGHWSFEQFLRFRAERRHWITAMRILKDKTVRKEGV